LYSFIILNFNLSMLDFAIKSIIDAEFCRYLADFF